MAHKFVPRKGLKGKDPAEPKPPVDSTPLVPPPLLEPSSADDSIPPPEPTEPGDDLPLTKAPLLKPRGGGDNPLARSPLQKGRSAKESILKKVPAKGAGKRSNLKVEAARKEKPARVSGGGGGGKSILILLVACLIVGGIVAAAFLLFTMNKVPGYTPQVLVKEANRLDWTFVEGAKSLEKLPPEKEGTYKAAEQRYELFVPPELDAAPPAGLPLVLFLSPQVRPIGWSAWYKVCQEHNLLFAGVFNPSDNASAQDRARAALDVLDDVRRQHRIDPDRTYLVGYGAGARTACRIAFALPELCGGAVAINGGDLPRPEPWLRRRAADRLSVAWLAGGSSKPETEQLFAGFSKALKVRSQFWEDAASGNLPGPERLGEVYQWLEEGLPQRQALAKQFPASRLAPDAAPSRAELAKLLLDEAQVRVQKPETFVSGLDQLRGCADRWESLPAGQDASRRFSEYFQREERPWLEEELKERRQQELALARAWTAYLTSSDLDPAEVIRNWDGLERGFNEALRLWDKVVVVAGTSQEVVEEGKKSMDKLKAAKTAAVNKRLTGS